MCPHCFWHCENSSKWQCVPFPHTDESTFKDFSPTWSYTDLILCQLDLTLSLLHIYGLPPSSWPNTALFVAWPTYASLRWNGVVCRSYFPLKFKGPFLPLSDISFLCFSGFWLAGQTLSLCLQLSYSDTSQFIWADLIHSIFYSSCRWWCHFSMSISSIHHLTGKPPKTLTLFWCSHFIFHLKRKRSPQSHLYQNWNMKNTFYLKKLMQIICHFLM